MKSLFDLQVNGFAGVDYQQPDLDADALAASVRALRAHQTHRILLTLVTDDIEALERKFRRIESFRDADPETAETVCGYHLEGPYLSPEPGYRGAHPSEKMKPPCLEEFRRLQEAARGNIKLITIAPEWPGSPAFIGKVVESGVVVSIGHSDASMEQIDDAIAAGLKLCTHVGNGVPGKMHRHDNIIQRLLSRDELTACFIPDGIHVPPFTLRNFVRAKPQGKAVFTTDCMAAAGAPPGRYRIGPHEVEVGRDRVVRQPGQTNFAGSALEPDQGVENAAAWLDLPPGEARTMFSTRVADLFDITLPEL